MSKFDELKIVEEYCDGMNTKELASKYNTYNTSIRRILIRHEVPLISNSERQRFVQTNPFKEQDPVSDYFLGLLIADGCISGRTITLGLKEEDVYMLEKFANFCSDKLKVTSYFHKAHGKLQYQVSFKQQEVSDWLQTKANFKNKSYDAGLYVPLNWNLLRGLSDGDGCFHVTKSNGLMWDLASGSKTILLQVQDFLLSYGLKSTLRYNHCWHLITHKHSFKLGQFLYSNSDSISLIRKKNIWAGYFGRGRKINTLNSREPSEGQS